MALVANENWLRLLADAGRLLGDSLEAEARLDGVAALAVPRLGDWCCIALTDGNGSPVRVAHAGVPGRKADGLDAPLRDFPFRPDTDGAGGADGAAPRLIADLQPESYRLLARGPEQLRLLAALDLRSVMLVPLRARARSLGTICFGISGGLRRYGQEDKAWAADLASRIALAVDNARLFRETREQAEALRRRESLYHALTENIPVMAWMSDREGRPLYFNRRCSDFAGCTVAPEQYAGGGLAALIHPDDLSGVLASRRGGMAREEPFQCEFRMRGGDGTYRWYVSRTVPVRDAEGRLEAWFGSAVDVHEARLAKAAALEEREKRMESQRMESIGRLAGGIAHDFNNLLTAVNGYADLLMPHLSADALAREYVNEIRKAGETAAGLTQKILAYGRRQMLLPRPTDLASLARAVEPGLAGILGDAIRLEVRAPVPAGPALVDAARLEQALAHLAANARDAMPRGGTVLLAVESRSLAAAGQGVDGPIPSGDYVVMTMEDGGTGIEPDVLPRIFEPFFTTKEIGSGPAGRTGSGLGLSMVWGVIKQSGGHIQVESEPGKGSRFRLYFPLYAARKDDAEERGRSSDTPAQRVHSVFTL